VSRVKRTKKPEQVFINLHTSLIDGETHCLWPTSGH
jgi:hypothetical protein